MSNVDFGIITAISGETEALQRRIQNLIRIRGIPPDIRDYYKGSIELGNGEKYEIVIVQCTQAGNADSGQAAKDLILRWDPSHLIMFGIAGGFPKGDLNIGDVIVATEILEYDYRRFYEKDWQPRPRHHNISAHLLAKINNLPKWEPTDLNYNNRGRKPKLQKPGPVASGNALFADAKARDRLMTLQQDIIAVEMESEGVAHAAWQRTPPIPVLVIRGICDLADAKTKGDFKKKKSRKSPEKFKQKQQKFAADSAASFLIHFLTDRPVEPNKNILGINQKPLLNTSNHKNTIKEVRERKGSVNISQPKLITNEKDGSVLVYIEAGIFQMGSSSSYLAKFGYYENEKVATEYIPHDVYLDSFFIGKFPITNAQYARFVSETGHNLPNRFKDGFFNNEKSPVIGVSWNDAQSYLEWAGLRLPTEAEWERVAKGVGNNLRFFPWGNQKPNITFMNFGRKNAGTTPVSAYLKGSTPETGIMDLSGNVLEWCLDDLRDYSAKMVNNPRGSTSSVFRAIRGGSFARNANSCRSSYRDRREVLSVWGSTGFRPALSL